MSRCLVHETDLSCLECAGIVASVTETNGLALAAALAAETARADALEGQVAEMRAALESCEYVTTANDGSFCPGCGSDAEDVPAHERASGKGSPKPRIDDWWPVDLLSGVDDGMAHRMDRVAATGNGQVPRVAVLAWETLR